MEVWTCVTRTPGIGEGAEQTCQSPHRSGVPLTTTTPAGNKYKKFSKSKERAPVRKESDESITTLGDDVEESKGLYLDLEVNQTVVSHSQQQPKRRSVKLDVGDLLYGGQGGQQDRETEPFSSGQTAPDTDGEERARPGEEQDLGLRLVTKEDEEENSSSDTKTAEKVFSAEVHTDSSGAENGTQSDKHVMKNTGPQSGTEELSFSKKGEGKSKKKQSPQGGAAELAVPDGGLPEHDVGNAVLRYHDHRGEHVHTAAQLPLTTVIMAGADEDLLFRYDNKAGNF
ncbi:hypothetical protein Bbelb_407840 [Branchiostoma belcheri]|nr:hypothetical protein Bbelb_407840 [Branchiostoma belcheri]